MISFRIDRFDVLAVQGTLKSLLQHHSSKASIIWHSALSIIQFSRFRAKSLTRGPSTQVQVLALPLSDPVALISLPHLSEPQFLPSVKGSDPCTTSQVRMPTEGGVGMGLCIQADKSLTTSVAALSLQTELLKLDLRCLQVENPHPNVQAMRRDPCPPTPCSSPHSAKSGNCLGHQLMPTRPQLETARNIPLSSLFHVHGNPPHPPADESPSILGWKNQGPKWGSPLPEAVQPPGSGQPGSGPTHVASEDLCRV